MSAGFDTASSIRTHVPQSDRPFRAAASSRFARLCWLSALPLVLLPFCVTVLLAQDTTEVNRLQPVFLAGATLGVVDLWEDNVKEMGYSARGGVRWRGTEVSAVADHWSTSRDGWDAQKSSIIVEGLYPFAPAARISPFLLAGIGFAWYEGVGLIGGDLSPEGAVASVGVGLDVALKGPVGVRAEAVLRGENVRGFVGQLRLSSGYMPRSRRPKDSAGAGRLEVSAYHMAAVRGPWRFVEPGYVLRYMREYSQGLSVGLAAGVFHWNVPGETALRNYLWDTRAFLANPSVQLRLRNDDLASVRGGPVVLLMGEGPDFGANLGLQAEAVSVLRPLGIPLIFTVGGLWVSRGPDADPRMGSGEDQLGLTLSAGMKL